MSVKALNQAFETKLNGNLKLVLLALADNADDNMQCFPSYAHIARKASVSISTAKRIVEKLEKIKAIRKENRFKKGKKEQTSNIYTLTIGGINMTLGQNDTTGGVTAMILGGVTIDTGGGVTAMTYEPSSLNHQIISLNDEERENFSNFKYFREFCIKNYEKIKFNIPVSIDNLRANTQITITASGYLHNLSIGKDFEKERAMKIWNFMYERKEKIIELIMKGNLRNV